MITTLPVNYQSIVNSLVIFFKKYAHIAMADWEKILNLLKSIGINLSFFIGFLLAKVSAEVPYLLEILTHFEEGKSYGVVVC